MTGSPNTSGLLDGQWHKLHPMTPFLRSGLGVLAVLGFTVTVFRDSLINLFLGAEQEEWDLWTIIQRYFLWILLGTIVILLIISAMFYLSWKMSSFRITEENIELRSGIIFKKHRQLRFDRVQDVSIQMPFIARLFGAARFRIAAAGVNASLHLDYLNSRDTKALRQDIFARTAQVKLTKQGQRPTPVGVTEHSGINDQLEAMLATEIDEDIEPETLVNIPGPRMVGSVIFSVPTGIILLVGIGLIIGLSNSDFAEGAGILLISFIPGAIALVAYFFSRIKRMLRYSIAQTPHGIRMSYGLLSRSVHTIPENKIHGVRIRQPFLWRMFGWWRVDITRASTIEADRQGMNESTVLPVGKQADAERVLALLLPEFDFTLRREMLEQALTGTGNAEGFSTATRRAIVYQPFTWRRNGWASDRMLGFMRSGYLSRTLSIIPLARVQGVRMGQGIFARIFSLASLTVSLVPGVVNTKLKNIDRPIVDRLFLEILEHSIAAANSEKGA